MAACVQERLTWTLVKWFSLASLNVLGTLGKVPFVLRLILHTQTPAALAFLTSMSLPIHDNRTGGDNPGNLQVLRFSDGFMALTELQLRWIAGVLSMEPPLDPSTLGNAITSRERIRSFLAPLRGALNGKIVLQPCAWNMLLSRR